MSTVTALLLAGLLAADPPPERPLTPGRPARAALGVGEAHVHTVSLRGGDFLQVTVAQDGADVAVAVTGPDGAPVPEGNAVGFRFGVEPASFVAASPGEYRLRVRSVDALGGAYVVLAREPRPATGPDLERVRAERALAEGQRLMREQKAESFRAAAESFERALLLFRPLGERHFEAATLSEAAGAQLSLGQYGKALELAGSALGLWRELADRHQQARALRSMAEAHFYQSDYRTALDEQQQALALRRELGDRAGQAETLNDMSHVRSALGEEKQAIQLASASLELWRSLRHPEGVLKAANTLGLAYFKTWELQKALDLFLEVLPRQRARGDREGEAETLVNVGAVYGWLGERESALERFGEALALYRALGERRGEATVLNNMGVMCHNQGRLDQALEHLTQSLTIRRALGERQGEAMSLINIGRAQLKQGDSEKAVQSQVQALEIARAIGDRRHEGAALDELGRAWHVRGDTAKALDHYQQALALTRSVGDRFREAALLSKMARIAFDEDDLALCRQQIEAALEILEAHHRSVRSRALQASLLATVRQVYERYVEVLMRLHQSEPAGRHDAEAFRVSERARARSLIALLAEPRESEGAVDAALGERERSLHDLLALKLDRQMRLQGGAHSQAEAKAVAREIESLSAEHEQVKGRIRAARASQAEPELLSVEEVQRRVLDEDTVLLEYVLGDARSFLWAVTKTSLTSRELPARGEIEGLARRAHELLSVRPSGAPAQELDEALASLSRILLGPVASALVGRRVLVAADGALHYVPFAVLPDPAAPAEPLVVRHDVVGLPSASLLAVLREETGHRKPAPKTVAVLADPVFDVSDERLRSRGAPEGPPGARDRDLSDAVRAVGLGERLPRLPFTRREARAILDLVPARERREALDFEASRATATHPELGDYRFVHFATHGFLNSSRPELSGLVLSLVDREGREQKGFLSAADVFGLRLSADMVVLSGCRTGLGRELTGEGLVGVSRAFMYAGAPRVLASLWKVDDAATAELMARVYRGMLKDGIRPAAALRAAQLALRSKRRFGAPHHWAAFQLQGDWN